MFGRATIRLGICPHSSLNNICSKGGRLAKEKISQLRQLAENDLLYSDSGSLKGTEMVQLTLL